MPVIHVSGDSAHERASEHVPGSVMVSKPFVPMQVLTALSMLLNEVPSRRSELPG